MIDLLVGFVKYLKREESIQGTIDDDELVGEHASAYLALLADQEREARLDRIAKVYPEAAAEARRAGRG